MSVTAVPLQPVKKSVKLWLLLGVLVAFALAGALAWVGTRDVVIKNMPNEEFLAANRDNPGVKQTASGLQYEVIKEGTGPAGQDGGAVILNYEGTFRDGKTFDKSQQPVPFPVLEGRSIPGFYEGLKLMKAGGEYRLWIPAKLAYGENTPDPTRLPPNSLLIFKVTVDRVLSPEDVQQMMMRQQMQGGAPGAPAGPEAAPQGDGHDH